MSAARSAALERLNRIQQRLLDPNLTPDELSHWRDCLARAQAHLEALP